MRKVWRLLGLGAPSACLALSLAGCGGDPVGPPIDNEPTPEPCIRTTVFQGAGTIPGLTADFESFTTTTAGRADVTLDWTHTDRRMAIFVAQGSCNFNQFRAGQCNFLLQLASPPKPLKGSIPNLAPGTYVYVILNTHPKNEAASTSVVLSSATCPAAASAAPMGEPATAEIRAGVMGILSR
jgi:hypothetical protein